MQNSATFIVVLNFNVIYKCMNRLNIIKILSSKNWKLNHNTLANTIFKLNLSGNINENNKSKHIETNFDASSYNFTGSQNARIINNSLKINGRKLPKINRSFSDESY
ncbi:hypothetical protein BpHYR1_033297 [Brachionus plicatilis]|uniref:Uncharacterized protein n=1 Tax=Brachionus plicatilis TaxID=10195 RepID=A0A3M7S7I1_BRAPC|nr:hypothetical protein BpHYR1_033297 [Brachionus plicatilis]